MYDLQDEFRDFVLAQAQRDLEFVQREIHFMSANCAKEGLNFEVPVQPLFLSQSLLNQYKEFGNLVHHVLNQVLKVLKNPLDPHYFEMKSLLRMDHEIEEILHCEIMNRGRYGPGVVRPDTVLSGNGFQAHEFNVSWPGGIADADIIHKVLSTNTLFVRFMEEMHKRGVAIMLPEENGTSRRLLNELLMNSEVDDPHIALMHPRPYTVDESDLHLARYLEDFIREQGHQVSLVHPDQLEVSGHKVRFDGREIDVAYRFFEWHHVVQDPGFLGYRKVLRAAMNGDLIVVNSFASEALSAKSIFEVIWDDSFLQIFDEEVIAAIRPFIPRTFNLAKAGTDDLEEIIEDKDNWVIKPVKGSSGMQVFLGSLVDDVEFFRQLVYQSKANGEMVAQEYVQTPELNVVEGQEDGISQATHYLDINPFYIGGGLAGFFARWSRTRMTAACSPGWGGMYPVVAYDNLI